MSNPKPYEDNECRHSRRTTDRNGDLRCQDCGMVYDEIVLEWIFDFKDSE